jgi:uncharacterized membrane protein HdeD (DUF308 family)
MIQRIQTLFLLIATLCSAFTYKFSFYSGNKIDKDSKQVFEKIFASSNFILLITTAVLVAGCLYLIFIYKTRKQQMWLTLAAAGLSIINLVIYYTETKKFESGTYSLTAILSLAIPVLLVLAARGIWKDEKLVKSVDRLR